jgi:cystathionine gamma-synthase
MDQNLKNETTCVHGASFFEKHTGAISFPIYQSATFRHPSLGKSTGYDYSRQQNPTREELEKTIALLEKAKFGFAFATGMAGITAVLSLFKPGDHILATDDLYGGTVRLFDAIFSIYGINATYIDTSDLNLVKSSIKPNTKAIYIESPSNPMMKITDIVKISEISKSHKLLTIIDNTFLTPYFFNPIELGADIVLHSGTKYLGGHNDTLAGFVVTNDDQLAERVQFYQKSAGGGLSPFDSWLVLRGIKTLAIRMQTQEKNAIQLAEYLDQHPKVTKVFFPGLKNHPGREILINQARGFGAMISFEVDSEQTAKRILEKVKVILFAESLGGVETLITYPMVQTHADVPVKQRLALGINDRLLRLSVGIEHPLDLIQDLTQALDA